MKTLYGVQYLRALAAVTVVGFHASVRAGGHFLIGEAGVDLFFVVSGFLMVAITDADTSPGRFLRDRATRIAPPYWIATTVFLIGAIVGALPAARVDLWHVVSSYLFLPSRTPGAEEVWPLLVPGWTLNYEAFFYVLFAGSLAAPRRFQLPIVTTTLVTLVAIGATWHPTGAAAFFYTRPILLEFLAGAWLGAYWHRHGAPAVGWYAIGAGMLLYLLAWWEYEDSWRVLTYALPALLMLTGALDIERRYGLPRWAPAKLIGDASFSIYLWHTMILSAASKVTVSLHLPRTATIVLGVAAGIGGGIVGYRLIERPMFGYLKRHLASRRTARTVR